MIEVCGTPGLSIYKDVAQVSFLLHTTDPDSTVHVEIFLYLQPATGRFWFERDWSW